MVAIDEHHRTGVPDHTGMCLDVEVPHFDVANIRRNHADAMAAGAGLHASVGDAAAAMSRVAAEPHVPDASAAEAYEGGYRRYRTLFDALAPHFAALA